MRQNFRLTTVLQVTKETLVVSTPWACSQSVYQKDRWGIAKVQWTSDYPGWKDPEIPQMEDSVPDSLKEPVPKIGLQLYY